MGDAQYAAFAKKTRAVEALSADMATVRVRLDDAPEALRDLIGPAQARSALLVELARRPEIGIIDLAPLYPPIAAAAPDVLAEVETRIKYEGYLRRQEDLVARAGRREATAIPADLDYAAIPGLSREAVEKLTRISP